MVDMQLIWTVIGGAAALYALKRVAGTFQRDETVSRETLAHYDRLDSNGGWQHSIAERGLPWSKGFSWRGESNGGQDVETS